MFAYKQILMSKNIRKDFFSFNAACKLVTLEKKAKPTDKLHGN